MKSNRSRNKKRKRRDSNDREDLARPRRPVPSQSTHPHQIASLAGDPEISISQGQYPETQPGSFFQSSSDVAVSGGSFTSDSSRNQQTIVSIVVNSPENKGKIQVEPSMPPHSNGSTPPPLLPEPQDLPQRGYNFNDPNKTGDLSSEILQQEHQMPIRRSSLPVQKSSAIYYRHLASKGRGSPLWIPEPSNSLPIAYQRNGIEIGDVGILTDHGSFNFLFNICTPARDPINADDVPERFHPIPKPRPSDVDEHLEFKSNSYLASSLVETFQQDEDSVGLIFESSASEGAILTMPNGSRSRDLVNVVNFRKYAYANAEKWYKYANEVRGRGARNGDLRLVVGYNSSNAWGMATFANHSTSAVPGDKQDVFRLKFKPIKQIGVGKTYGWECSGMAEVKSGPDSVEVESLRSGGECDQGESVEGDPNLAFENQCLFVRTLNVTLQKDVWDRLSAEWAGLYSDDDPWLASSQDSPSFFGHSSDSSNNSGAAANTSGHTSPDSTRDGGTHKTSKPSAPQQERNIVHLSSLPTPLDLHPSKAINEFLLRERPKLKMAITEDRDWISVLNMDEQGFPAPEVICGRLVAAYDICEEEGAVFVQPRNIISNRRGDGQEFEVTAINSASSLLPFNSYHDDINENSSPLNDQATRSEPERRLVDQPPGLSNSTRTTPNNSPAYPTASIGLTVPGLLFYPAFPDHLPHQDFPSPRGPPPISQQASGLSSSHRASLVAMSEDPRKASIVSPTSMSESTPLTIFDSEEDSSAYVRSWLHENDD